MFQTIILPRMEMYRDLFRCWSMHSWKEFWGNRVNSCFHLSSGKHRLVNFLIMYCSTTHTVTGKTPSELFRKHHIRTLKPDLTKYVQEKQLEQKKQHYQGKGVLWLFAEEEQVHVWNFRGGQEKWLRATVIERKEVTLYMRVRESALCMWITCFQRNLEKDIFHWGAEDTASKQNPRRQQRKLGTSSCKKACHVGHCTGSRQGGRSFDHSGFSEGTCFLSNLDADIHIEFTLLQKGWIYKLFVNNC